MIPLFKVYMRPEATEAVGQVLQSGFIGQGDMVDRFEHELEKITPYGVVSTNSCTSAIHAVLIYLGIGPGDEVITTPLTCVATNAPILAVGARPVWADVLPTTGLIDPADVGRKITKRTKAIIAVDWTGRAADYTALKSFGIPVIEDAAHNPMIGDRPTGDFICYSFGPIKHLTAGDGGAISTPNPNDRAALRLLRWYGLDRTSSKDFRCSQDITRAGMKFHMNDINAAIGLVNLEHLPSIVQKHRANASRLFEYLRLQIGSDYAGSWISTPDYSDESNYWVYPIRVLRGSRASLKAHLTKYGIMSSQVHARNDGHTAYQYPCGDLPGLNSFDKQQLNLPCGWWLKDEDISKILHALRTFTPCLL